MNKFQKHNTKEKNKQVKHCILFDFLYISTYKGGIYSYKNITGPLGLDVGVGVANTWP